MKLSSRTVCGIFLVLIGLLPQFPAYANANSVPGEILVGFRPGAKPESPSGTFAGFSPTLNAIRLRFNDTGSMDSAVAELRAKPHVAYVEPNYIRHTTASPNDPLFVYSQYAPQKIKADKAWDAWQPKANVIIAIVDTGIEYSHNDLKNILLRDGAGNVVGYNALTRGTNANDDNGHGTHVAGIAAGQINNGVGGAGIAAWNPTLGNSANFVRLMPVKVLNSSGSGADSGIADGITWAANHGAKIINLSLGSQNFSNTVNNAVQYAWSKGCVIVASAGNDSSTTKFYPAAYNNVISVAATDATDTLSYFSNYGSWVKAAAPGSSILSTYKGDYARFSGTSMASPHVSGEAAILLSQSPAMTNSQISAQITSSTDPYTPYLGRTLGAGAGRINVQEALEAVNGPSFSIASSVNAAVTGSPLSVSWTVPQGRPESDWVALFREGDPNTVYGWWKFTEGASTGSFELKAPEQAGVYQFRYLLEGGYVDAARSVSISITAPSQEYSVATSAASVPAGGTLSVSWMAPQGRPATDWIGLFKVGDPNTAYGWWRYTAGAQSGSLSAAAPSATGTYEFRYLLQNGYTSVATSGAFSVTSAPSSYALSASAASVSAGGSVTVTWTAPAGRPYNDWVGLFKVGDPNTAYGWWRYTNGTTSGSFTITVPNAPGTYEFRYLLQNGFTDSARSGPISVGS